MKTKHWMTKLFRPRPPASFRPASQAGYNLLQMAMALMVIGVIGAAFIQIYKLYSLKQDMLTTQSRVEDAVKKLQEYRQTFGYYPCPAPLDAARTSPTYGVETNCASTAILPGNCSGGICIGTTTRLVDDDNNPATPDVTKTLRVRVGALPFRVLQMDEKSTVDAYGSRLVYGMTEAMGTAATFKELEGGVALVDEQNQALTSPAGSAAFVILSPGPNKVGAFSRFGVQERACAGATLDVENCIDFASPSNVEKFVNSFVSDATFDDVVQYFATASNPMWRRTTTTSDDITDMVDNNVGVGTTTPVDELTVAQSTIDTDPTSPTYGYPVTTNSTSSPAYQSGAVRAGRPPVDPTPGAPTPRIMADEYCDQTNTYCFQIKDILGNPTLPTPTGGMKCSSDYMVAITSNGTNAVPDCQPVRVKCPTGQAMRGLNADGTPVCATPSMSCPSTTINTCGHPFVFGAGGNGAYAWISTSAFVPGSCRVEWYQCNAGTWTLLPGWSSGTCSNIATTGLSCGTGYTGTYSTYSCTGSTFSTDCTCTGVPPHTETASCSSPFTGGSRTRVCSQACLGNSLLSSSCTPWTGSCTCSSTDYWSFAYCPSGYRRNPSAAPLSSPATPWPTDIFKGVATLQNINSTTCSYSPGSTVSDCVCDGTPHYAAQTVPTPAPTACWKPKPGGRSVYDGGTLALASVPYDQEVMKYPVDMATCTVSGTGSLLPDAAQFVPKPHYWRRTSATKSNATTDPTTSGNPVVDDPCTCTTELGSSRNCALAVAGGYDTYVCTCKP